MVERLKVVHYAVSLGHHRSLIYWIPTAAVMAPPSVTRTRRSPATGHSPGTGIFRFSVGIENAEDICADLDQVL